MSAIKIGFFGNCQFEALQQIFGDPQLGDLVALTPIKAVHKIAPQDHDAFLSAVQAIDILYLHYTSERHGLYSYESVARLAGDKVRLVPNLECHAFTPQLGYFGDDATLPRTDYVDYLVLAHFLAGSTPENAAGLYLEGSLESGRCATLLADERARHHRLYQEGRVIFDYSPRLDAPRERSFWTFNHPRREELAWLATSVLQNLGSTRRVQLANELLDGNRAPVLPATSTALGIPRTEDDDAFMVFGRRLSALDYVKLHYESYGELDRAYLGAQFEASTWARLGGLHPAAIRARPAPQAAREVDPGLLKTSMLDTLMVEVTSTCNLRCGYCPKSQPGDELLPGRNEEMQAAVLPAVRQMLEEFRTRQVLAAGTGETTFRKDWIEVVDGLRQPGGFYHLNTNLSLDYSDAELEALARFDMLTVSIDTYDRETTRRLRSKSDLRKIAFNMVSLRSKLRGRKKRPQIVVNCTLTNLNALHVYETWKFCSELGFDAFVISGLIELDYAKTKLGITSWESLSQADLKAMVDQLNRIIGEAKAGGAAFNLQQSLRAEIQDAMQGKPKPSDEIPIGQTRACVQPWRRVTVAADGEVYPCCVTVPEMAMGKVTDPAFSLNGDAFQRLRKALLEGRPPPTCRTCTNAPRLDAATFRSNVGAMIAAEKAHSGAS
jgi:radical SAM protein with 4Fe4S-binding SPASM domain